MINNLKIYSCKTNFHTAFLNRGFLSLTHCLDFTIECCIFWLIPNISLIIWPPDYYKEMTMPKVGSICNLLLRRNDLPHCKKYCNLKLESSGYILKIINLQGCKRVFFILSLNSLFHK